MSDHRGSELSVLDYPSRDDHDTRSDDAAPIAPQNETQSLLIPVSRRDQVIVLINGFFVVFATIGPNLSYGVFQDFYVSNPETILPPDEASDRALVAFVGTLAAGLTWGGAIYVNPLMAKSRSFVPIAVTGSCLMGLGYLLASFASMTWQLLLTQGLIAGVGSSMLYFPLLSVAPEYFDARRGTAMGVVLSAAGVGGVVYSLITQAFLDRVGARWALRILALITVAITLPIALAARPSRNRSQRPLMVSWKLAKSPAFILFSCAALLQAAGNFVPLSFTPEFSTILGYTTAFGAALLSINNAVNAVSRIVTGVMADAFGRQNILIISVVLSALSVAVLWYEAAVLDAQGLWIAFVVIYGGMAGGYMALFPTTIASVFGVENYASVNSMAYFARGLGAAFGSPVGGLILGDNRATASYSPDPTATLTKYQKLIWYDAALLLGSSVCVIGVRGIDAFNKQKWSWKA